jgi:deazaflavin-dependent oxidoreductase (nitroreductase family)
MAGFTYKRPPFFVAEVANPLLGLLVRMGLRPSGAAILTVAGRTSGKPRRTPVNPLEMGGTTYLVAPRGDTHWARNLRAAKKGDLSMNRKTIHFTAEEVPVEQRAPLLRAYLDRWAGVTKSQFEVRGDETVDELAAIAPRHPVFRLARQ